jgi:long-chain fatty acid transport protein
VFGNPATLAQYFGGTHFMFGATFYMPRAQMVHDGSAGFAVTELGQIYTDRTTVAAGGLNPGNATLSDFESGNGINTAYGFDSRSAQDIYAVPQVAVTQDLSGLGIPVVLGVGVTATNGIGVDYQHSSNSIGAAAELINLGVNAGIGMKMSDTLDVGVALTITYAMLEAGLTGSGTQKHDIGFRGTIGARKHLGNTTVGMYYQGELEHQYANLHVTSMAGSAPHITNNHLNNYSSNVNAVVCNGTNGGVCRQDVEVQQPWNIGLGIAHNLDANTLVMLDFTHKKWSDAKFFNEFYDDQNVISIGIQKTMGNLKLRAGYGYADDPLLSRVKIGNHIASIGGVDINGNTYTSPMYGLFMSYFQAMETPVIYKHRITAGLGVESFLGVPFLSLDAHVAVQLEEDKCFGSGQNGLLKSDGYYDDATVGHALTESGLSASGCTTQDHTKATISSFHMGGALTWAF